MSSVWGTGIRDRFSVQRGRIANTKINILSSVWGTGIRDRFSVQRGRIVNTKINTISSVWGTGIRDGISVQQGRIVTNTFSSVWSNHNRFQVPRKRVVNPEILAKKTTFSPVRSTTTAALFRSSTKG